MLSRILRWRLVRGSRSCVLLGLGLVACGGNDSGGGGLEPPPPRGSLAVSISGLPGGSAAQVQITGPGGYGKALGSSEVLKDLAPGAYSVNATGVTAVGHAWSPSPALQDVIVTAGTETPASVDYAVATGALTIAVTGLPAGTPAALTLSGPGGFSQAIATTVTLTGLVPGAYAISGSTVTSGASQYAPAIPPVPAVTAALAPVEVTVDYARLTGSIVLAVTGLPDGVAPVLALAGPGGYASNPAGGTLGDLNPGDYTLTATSVSASDDTYSPATTTQTVVVAAGGSTSAAVHYGVSTGRLNLSVTGVPAGAQASITVTGPGGFSQLATASTNYKGLVPGTYTITAASLGSGGHTWTPTPISQQVNVPASKQPVSAGVAYTLATGALNVTLSGLPPGSTGSATIAGPGGFNQTVTANASFKGLTPGTYTITAPAVTVAGQPWLPSPASQQVNVIASLTPASAAVAWSQSTGALTVTVSGLPGGASAAVTVTGPGGFSQVLTTTTTLTGLAAGSYTIAAANVSSGGTTYAPTPGSQNRTVTAGATATATVTYAGTGGGGGTLNLRIDGLYVTQAAQRYNGTAPLVAGRGGYLRVFVLANEANTAAPQVRVRLYAGGSLVQTYTISAPAAGVPLAVNEGSLTASWNVLIPAGLMQPGLTALADVDPTNALAETSETDNTFPASGTPGPVDVRTLPTFNLRFVPVLQSANGLQGNVTAGNAGSFLPTVRTLLPVGAYDADVRAAYTTSAPALQSDNANGAWGTVLSEVLALKSADASQRYYYGVVKTSYTSGVAGMGYVGGSARTAIGWDRLPSGSEVMAHEVGHNMGRQHAPCGGAGGPDPGYPYAGGSIGIWGLDVAALQLKNPASFFDLMGYCNPDWVSDYNWQAMLTYRQAGPNNSVGQSDRLTVGRGVLVWGRITPTGPVLEPAFEVDRGDLSPPAAGPHRLEVLDAAGRALYSAGFASHEVADLPGGREEAFAFVVPLASSDIAELRLASGGRTVSRRSAALLPAPSALFAREQDGRGVLTWDARAHPVVMVRDAGTGQVLSFARGGSVRLPATATRLEATFSDGARSTRVTLDRR